MSLEIKDEMHRYTRRGFLLAAAALLAGGSRCWADDHPSGPVEPSLLVPDLPLICSDGSSTSLRHLVENRVTAVQLMLTSCTTTCPIQGAIFRHVQNMVAVARGIQLVSLSVDPQLDTPLVLSHWLGQFHAQPGWIAAAPHLRDLKALREFFGTGTNPDDNHTAQVSLIDRRKMLVYKTSELPDPATVAHLLEKMA